MTGRDAMVAISPRYNISKDDRLRHRDRYWQLERRRGDTLDFIDPHANELLTVTDEELAGLIAQGRARIVRSGATEKDVAYAAATADLSNLRSCDIEDGRRKAAYTEELRQRGLAYRPATSEVEEAIAAVAARIGDPQPPAPYLAKRWCNQAEKRAAGGGRLPDQKTIGDFVPQHGFKGNRTSRVCFELSKIIHAKIEEIYLTRERRSIDSLLAAVRDKVRTLNETRDPDDQLRVPGRKSVESAIASLPRDDEFGPVEYRARPEAPLDEVEMDHTTCDLFVVDGLTGAPLGRPTIALAADRATAMPYGLHVGFDPPSVHTVMQCLRNAMLPKSYVRHYVEAGIWDIKGTNPAFGRLRQLSVDRGAENINYDLKAIGIDLPVKKIEAKAGRKGRLKGGIERFLGTVNRDLLQEQRGTTFSNILDRDDYDPRKNAVITYEELLEKIHHWLIDVYMVRRHNGIRDVPLRLWNEKILKFWPEQVENVDKILPLFGRVEHRILRRDGIRWKHLFFTSPELMALLTNEEFCKASRNVKGDIVVRFRYDPSNIDHIHVYLPHCRGQETMHLKVQVEKRSRDYCRGLSVWAHDAILKMARELVGNAIDQAALDKSKTRLIANMDAGMTGSAKVRGMSRIARLRQIGGVAPYGDSVRTTPVGSFEDKRQEAALAASGPAGSAGRGLPPEPADDSSLTFPADIVPVEDDDQDLAALEADARPKPSAISAKKAKYSRASDPAVGSRASRKPRPGGRGRKAVPTTTIPAGHDDVDYYSEEMRA
jgi:putative transposase